MTLSKIVEDKLSTTSPPGQNRLSYNGTVNYCTIETTQIWYCDHSLMVLRPFRYGIITILTFKFSKISRWYYDHSNIHYNL
ncbi:hypothetical protein MTR_7g446090 [Medicago truncatula]|uniref:Uncharacterized protein n=1 Tax=Medicago truncatula TaxID=3880 RepID=A0A072TZV7_MEDTR|nr:hypothetical protein MTR_7g446090 [Medicago truncatula]